MIITRAIKSGRPFKSSIFREEMQATAHIIARSMEGDFKKTVENWDHKVKFRKQTQVGKGKIEIEVSTGDKIYGYVDRGTKPHKIPKRPFPKDGKRLWFQEGFEPKTKPGVIGSWRAGSYGKWIPARQVNHPGTKPRKFEETIRDKWKGEFRRQIKNALARFVRRTGHGV